VSGGSISSLRRRLERERERADRTDQELEAAIRERIRTGPRGTASAIARELGWDRRRLNEWLKVRADRDSRSALTGREVRSTRGDDANRRTEPNGGTE
jgi:hypothetical protein